MKRRSARSTVASRSSPAIFRSSSENACDKHTGPSNSATGPRERSNQLQHEAAAPMKGAAGSALCCVLPPQPFTLSFHAPSLRAAPWTALASSAATQHEQDSRTSVASGSGGTGGSPPDAENRASSLASSTTPALAAAAAIRVSWRRVQRDNGLRLRNSHRERRRKERARQWRVIPRRLRPPADVAAVVTEALPLRSCGACHGSCHACASVGGRAPASPRVAFPASRTRNATRCPPRRQTRQRRRR